MIKISGFTDEINSKLDVQLALLKEIDGHYMCPRVIDGENIADIGYDKFVSDVKPKLDKAQIKFSSLGSPIGKIALDDGEAYSKQLEKLKELVKIAECMNCKYIRIFSFFVDPDGDYDRYFPRVVEKTKGFLKVVEETDIILLHENEKKIYADTPERVLKLYNAVNNPQFKLIYDASNFIQCGVDPWEAYNAIKQFVVYFHMKDCIDGVECPLGVGQGRIEEILSDAVKRGYDGFLTLEPHTLKYALTKIPFYILPFLSLSVKNSLRVYRQIDKAMNVRALQPVGRKQVYLWQYENLKKILDKVGAKYERS